MEKAQCYEFLMELSEELVNKGNDSDTLSKASEYTQTYKKIIELFTTFGYSFKICSRQKLDDLFALLQLERVKIIYPIEGITVSVYKEEA